MIEWLIYLEKTMKIKNDNDNLGSQVIKQVPATIKLGHPDTYSISLVCSMYASAIKTLTQIRLEILAGLCYGDLLLPNFLKPCTLLAVCKCA